MSDGHNSSPATESEEGTQSADNRSDGTIDLAMKMVHWLFFGIFLSFVPLLCSICFNVMIGYNFSLDENKLKYLVDFLLAIFAVATNACGCTVAWSCAKKEGKFLKALYIAFSTFSMSGCTILYAYFFNVPKEFQYGFMDTIFHITIVVLIINSLIGFLVAWHERPQNGSGK